MIIVFGAILATIMVAIVVTLLAKRQLGEKYAVLWLIIGIAAIVIIAFPGLLERVTHAAGVQVPANLLFGGAILLLVGVALHLSWELSRAESEIRRLAEDTAINRLEIEKLARQVGEPSAPRIAESSGDDEETGDSGVNETR